MKFNRKSKNKIKCNFLILLNQIRKAFFIFGPIFNEEKIKQKKYYFKQFTKF
jgi:hypothetical protein